MNWITDQVAIGDYCEAQDGDLLRRDGELKPGGRVALLDISHTREYARVFQESGLGEVVRSGPRFLFGIPTHALTPRKPPAEGVRQQP